MFCGVPQIALLVVIYLHPVAAAEDNYDAGSEGRSEAGAAWGALVDTGVRGSTMRWEGQSWERN
jgi:hypothetical protein